MSPIVNYITFTAAIQSYIVDTRYRVMPDGDF